MEPAAPAVLQGRMRPPEPPSGLCVQDTPGSVASIRCEDISLTVTVLPSLLPSVVAFGRENKQGSGRGAASCPADMAGERVARGSPAREGARHQHPHPSPSCFLSQESVGAEERFWERRNTAASPGLLLRPAIWIL